MLRLGQAPGVPGILFQAGIRNASDQPIKLRVQKGTNLEATRGFNVQSVERQTECRMNRIPNSGLDPWPANLALNWSLLIASRRQIPKRSTSGTRRTRLREFFLTRH